MVVVVVGAQKVPFQAVFGPHPPTGGLGVVVVVLATQALPFQYAVVPHPPTGGLGVVVVVVVGAQKVPFQAVFDPHPPTGILGAVGAVTVGAGPPFFSQLDCVEPSLHRTAWALGATKSIRPVDMIESARRSDEAALKRFITSSKAGLLGKRLLPFLPAPAGAK